MKSDYVIVCIFLPVWRIRKQFLVHRSDPRPCSTIGQVLVPRYIFMWFVIGKLWSVNVASYPILCPGSVWIRIELHFMDPDTNARALEIASLSIDQ
jgi:hypothetical protein